MHQVVIGILESGNVETAINNLTEADIPEQAISLIMQDTATARKIIDDAGPLQGVTAATTAKALEQRGVNKLLAEKYEQLVEQGKALLAISGDQEMLDLARDIFNDYPHIAVLEV